MDVDTAYPSSPLALFQANQLLARVRQRTNNTHMSATSLADFLLSEQMRMMDSRTDERTRGVSYLGAAFVFEDALGIFAGRPSFLRISMED